MTKIDIISGFLGAGKTSFIQTLLAGALKDEQVVLIENEFGEISVDSGFLKDSGIEIREMSQGCICCSLVGDFETSLKEVVEKYSPERIIIEPSGVGKLSDIIGAVKSIAESMDVELHAAVTVVDAKKAKLYSKNFGEFFDNQIQYAGTVVLSRTDIATEEKIQEALDIVNGLHEGVTIITTPVKELSGSQLLDIISKPDNMRDEMLAEVMERVRENIEKHGTHNHSHGSMTYMDEDGNVVEEHGHDTHHHEHAHDEHKHHHSEHEHHHDEHKSHHDEYEHEHHHEEGEHCEHCEHHGEHGHHEEGHHHEGHHHHHEHGHHHHDADEIFTTWGLQTAHSFSKEWLEESLNRMANTEDFGQIVRAKGMLKSKDGTWLHFDMVPEQVEIRTGSPDYTGKLVVIGAELKEDALLKLFREAD